MKESSTNGLFVKLYKTYTNTPRARMVPRMRRMERNLGSMLLGFAFDTCPSLDSFTGCIYGYIEIKSED